MCTAFSSRGSGGAIPAGVRETPGARGDAERELGSSIRGGQGCLRQNGEETELQLLPGRHGGPQRDRPRKKGGIGGRERML